MTVGELKEKLTAGTISDIERAHILQKAVDDAIFSDVSLMDLLKFQEQWDSNKPFNEFLTAQNKVICKCIDIEVSSFGIDARKAMGLKPITLETEI